MEYTLEASILSKNTFKSSKKYVKTEFGTCQMIMPSDMIANIVWPVKIQETSMSFAFSYCCLIHRKANDEVVIACVL